MNLLFFLPFKCSRKPESIAVVVGSLDPSASSDNLRQETVASGFWLYPGYPGGTVLDVALIRLKKPLKWRADSVQPACLPPQVSHRDHATSPKRLITFSNLFSLQKATKIRDGQMATVAGWGWNDEDGIESSALFPLK